MYWWLRKHAFHSNVRKCKLSPIIPNSSELKTEVLPTVGACYYINNSGQIVYSRDSVDSSLVDKIDNDSNEGRINGSLYQSLAEDLTLLQHQTIQDLLTFIKVTLTYLKHG